MTDTPLRLWSFELSPYAGKVRVALAEKGVDYELVELAPGNRPARLKELNPLGKVPVLEVDGYALRESSVICEWLEETHPDPALLPTDPHDRAWLRAWGKWIDDEITSRFFLSMRKFAFGKDEGDPDDIVERLQASIPASWSILEEQLGRHDGPWLLGNSFTLADLCGMADAVRMPQWTPHLLPDPTAHPRVTSWMEALRSRPSASAIELKGDPVHSGDDD